MVFTRAIVVPVWILAFLLVALFPSRSEVTTPWLFALAALAIMALVAMTVRGVRRVRPPVLELMPGRLDTLHWKWRPARGMPAMPFTRNTLASLWIIAFGLFALSGGATIAAPALLLLVVASLAALATRWTAGARVSHVRAITVDRHAPAASDTPDLIRIKSEKE
jgi:hypothetical protein